MLNYSFLKKKEFSQCLVFEEDRLFKTLLLTQSLRFNIDDLNNYFL